jgi:hypothetical protein
MFDLSAGEHPVQDFHEHNREVLSVYWNMVTKDTFVSSSWDGTIKVVSFVLFHFYVNYDEVVSLGHVSICTRTCAILLVTKSLTFILRFHVQFCAGCVYSNDVVSLYFGFLCTLLG